MQKIFHSTLDSFIGAGELPVWVVYRGKGVHPARFFHDHNYSEIAVIISGPARHILDGENVPVATGDVLIVHPGAVHAYDETGEMEIINLIFDPSRLSLPQLDGYSLPLFGKIFPDGKNLYHSANPAARLAPENLIDIFIRGMFEFRNAGIGEIELGLENYGFLLPGSIFDPAPQHYYSTSKRTLVPQAPLP